MKKHCPSCGRTYTGQEVFCGKCGVLLEREKNRCSTNRTELCRGARLEDDDLFCPYCGEPTTFARSRKDGKW